MKNGYTVVCLVEAKPDKILEMKEAFVAVVEPSRLQQGCLEFRLHQNIDNPAQFVFYETWASEEAHEQHSQGSHIQALAAKLPDLLAKPYFVVLAKEIQKL